VPDSGSTFVPRVFFGEPSLEVGGITVANLAFFCSVVYPVPLFWDKIDTWIFCDKIDSDRLTHGSVNFLIFLSQKFARRRQSILANENIRA
jgi:hypothetical protein